MFSFGKKTPIRLVIGLNQVDKMIIDGWDSRLNLPKKEAEQRMWNITQHLNVIV
jgi:hypothetical protein